MRRHILARSLQSRRGERKASRRCLQMGGQSNHLDTRAVLYQYVAEHDSFYRQLRSSIESIKQVQARENMREPFTMNVGINHLPGHSRLIVIR